MRSCTGNVVTSSPKKRMRPELGGKSPVTALNNVVLPAPLEPRIARLSPAPTRRLTSARATSAPNWRPTPTSSSAKPEFEERRSATLWSTISGAVSGSSLAVRIVAVRDAKLKEVRFGNAERLVDGRDDPHNLVVEVAVVRLGDLREVVVSDGLPVLVELDLAGRRVEFEIGQRLAEFDAVVGQVALDLVKRRQHRLGFDVVALGKQRGGGEAVLVRRLVLVHELLPGGSVVVVGDRAGCRRADHVVALLALRAEHGLIHGDRAADQRRRAARLLILAEEIDAVGAAERDVDRVDLVGDRGDHG